jgi:Domain of unknown function (DUF4261)
MRLLFILWCCCAMYPAFAQRKEALPAPTPKVVTGVILLKEKAMPDLKTILTALPKEWSVRTDSANISDKTAVFSSNGGATVMLAYLEYGINPAEINAAAGISWLWKTAKQDAAAHKAQLVISVIGTDDKTLELYRLFTKTAACALSKTPAVGVYMNSQYLLLEKDYYLQSAKNMDDKSIPLYCWVYFGILRQNDKSGGYTYGLSEFGLQEMEISQSSASLQEAHALLFDAALYVVRTGTRLSNGQVVQLSPEQKISVALSDAVFLEGKTLKVQ